MQEGQSATLASGDAQERSQNLRLLIGQEMEVPKDADPLKALHLAAQLAQESDYQRSRRALNNWEEAILTRTQTKEDDARELADLVAALNRLVRKHCEERRTGWIFRIAKASVEALLSPVSLVVSAIEMIEFKRHGAPRRPEGPEAVFFDIREKVIKPSESHSRDWDVV